MNQPSALVERPSSESVDFSDWLLLDCCFGIPLFDANLNKEICGKILEHNLLNTDRWVETPADAFSLELCCQWSCCSDLSYYRI